MLAVRKLYNIAVYDDVMWAHVTHPKIADIIADLLGTDDIKMYGDQLFMKAPRHGLGAGLASGFGLLARHLPHGLGLRLGPPLTRPPLTTAASTLPPALTAWGMLRGERLAPFVADLESGGWPIRPAPLRAGSISFHHSLTLHQSNANLTGTRRRGYAVHYMRATSWRDEAVTDAPKMPPFKQVRGRSFPGEGLRGYVSHQMARSPLTHWMSMDDSTQSPPLTF